MTPLASALDRAGTAQPDRLLAALREGAVGVDERSLTDLLGWAQRYARLLRFRTTEDADGGDWAAFLAGDPSVLVAAVAETDLEASRAAVMSARDAFLAAAAAPDQQTAAETLLAEAAALATTLGSWRRRAVEGLGLSAELDRLAATSLGRASRDLHALALRADAIGLANVPPGLADAVADLGAAPALADPVVFPTGTVADADERAAFAEAVVRAYDALHAGAGYLTGRAPALLDETLTAYPAHEPHVGLFLAFLLLFRHAQDLLNAFGERHLQWTYRDVLGLAPHEEAPESVRVVFELARAADRHLLPAGTRLRGDKGPDGVERLYATDDDLVVTPAHVARLLALRTEAGARVAAPSEPARLVIADAGPEALVEGLAILKTLFLTRDRYAPSQLPSIEVQTGGIQWPAASRADLDTVVALTAAHGAPVLYVAEQPHGSSPGATTSPADDTYFHGLATLSPTAVLFWPKADPDDLLDVILAFIPNLPVVMMDLGTGAVRWNAVATADEIAEWLASQTPPASPGVWAAPVADSADGEGAEIERDDGSWAPFGDAATPAARLGVAVASDVLRLAEGERRVAVTLTLDRLASATTADLDAARAELAANLRVSLTGEKGWIEVPIEAVAFEPVIVGGTLIGPIKGDGPTAEGPFPGGGKGHVGVLTEPFRAPLSKAPSAAPSITLELALGADLPAVVPYAEAAHALGLGHEVGHPVLRIECVDGYAARGRTATDAGLSLPHVPTPETEAPYVEGAALPAGALVSHEGRVWIATTGTSWLSTPGTNATAWREAARAHPLRHLGATDGRTLGEPRLLGVAVAVSVDGLRALVAQGGGAVVDPSKTVAPFGMQPRAGARFVVGSPELQKPLSAVRLSLNWEGLPEESFAAHYAEYAGDGLPTVPTTADFTAEAALLVDGTWQPLLTDEATPTSTVRLFTGSTPEPSRALAFAIPEPPEPATAPFTAFGPDVRDGALRLTLTQGFLHRLYPKRTAEIAIAGVGGAVTLPNPPVTPLAADLALGYDARAEADYTALDARDADALPVDLYHLGPFGAAPVVPAVGPDREAGDVLVRPTLLPRATVVPDAAPQTPAVALEAALCVGVAGAEPPETLSLLVQVVEGTADPDALPPPVVWQVLESDTWRTLRPDEVLADTTGGMLRSGLVRLALPRAADAAHRLLPADLRWVRAAIARSTGTSPDGLNRLIAVQAQAARATRIEGLGPGEDALPAGTVSKLKARPPAVKGVAQPFMSVGGAAPEGRDAFVRRVSERLGHRARGVTPSDVERLALEAFPVLHRVRCVPHTRVLADGTVREAAPGHVGVVVVPDLARMSVLDPLRPRVSRGLLAEIAETLAGGMSDLVTLDVRNATYEAVRVEARIRFREGVDVGYALGAVDAALVDALSPWRDDGTIRFGGRVHRSWVLRFLEAHPSVDAVRDLHLIDATGAAVEEAEASTPLSVLTSAAAHVLSEWIPLPCPTP